MSAENKCRQHIILEWVVVAVAITIFMAIFSIPAVVFYIYQDNGGVNLRDILSDLVSQLHLCNNQTMATSLVGIGNECVYYFGSL